MKFIGILLCTITLFNCSFAQKKKITTPAKSNAIEKSNLIPENVSQTKTITEDLHPLATKINTFLNNQSKVSDFESLGFNKKDYLTIIERQTRAMLKYQIPNGRLIDPVEKVEKYYSTPCFAHSVAVLISAGHIEKTDPLFESGTKALSAALSDMVHTRVNGNHGDFYTWPVMLAYENFKPFVSKELISSWDKSLASLDISKLYAFYNKKKAMNWILVHSSGEFLRAKSKFTSQEYADEMLGYQLSNFTNLGMYNEGGNPLSYDLFARHYLAGVLQLGYEGKHEQVLQSNLWKGAWSSLFIQSPFGELPTGYRSSHHIWNEAEQCVIFEIFAAAYAKQGKEKEAGAFKRAAMLSLKSIKQWIREDGSGYIVKNRFPIENKHGYERYSVHTCYNMLATSMLAQAWQFSNDNIKELPAPAEFKGSNPQLGPSNGLAPYFSGEGINIATGPSWQTPDGEWTALAKIDVEEPKVEILEESAKTIRFRVTHDVSAIEGTEDQATITETFMIKDDTITVSNEFKGIKGKKRITWPMLIFDGEKKAKLEINSSNISLKLRDKGIKLEVLTPENVNIKQSENSFNHVNGKAKVAFIQFSSENITYTLKSDK